MSAKFYYRFAAHIPNRGFVLFSPEWCGCEVVSDVFPSDENAIHKVFREATKNETMPTKCLVSVDVAYDPTGEFIMHTSFEYCNGFCHFAQHKDYDHYAEARRNYKRILSFSPENSNE